jgi:hypothetical protein
MKRKGSVQGLYADPKVSEQRTKYISVSAEHHLNALRKGYGKSFTSHIANLKLTCRLLAWSSQGTLVFAPPSSDVISPTNTPGDIYGPTTRLYATVPSYDVSTKRSGLLHPVSQPNPLENTPIDHILFNETGTHLVVVDELGTITIWEQDSYAAHLIPRQSFPGDNAGDTHESANRIVSLRWLHNDAKFHVALKLSKNGDQWTCQTNSQRGYGPCNLVAKEALLAITADARVFRPTIIETYLGESNISVSKRLENGDIET